MTLMKLLCRAKAAADHSPKCAYLLLMFAGAIASGDLDFAAPATATQPPVTANQSHALDLQGAPNFRDVGGYATADGRHVRRGEIFRSGELSRLTPADVEKVDSLKIASVIDLRTEEERMHAPSPWRHPPQDLYASPKTTLAPVMRTILGDAGTADGARAGLIKFYTQMPDSYRDEYSAMFHRIAAGKLPVLVHCTAGKDRTGVAVAVLLTTIGVPRQTVIDDYAMTETLVPPAGAASVRAAPVGGAAQALARLPEESRLALWRSDPKYISAALKSIDGEYGSVNAYLERGLGLTKGEIRALRTVLVK
jgi:protein-tyrosine phosphatase